MFSIGEFNWATQFVFPLLFGGIVGFLRYLYQDKNWNWQDALLKHVMAGAVAGIVAVNMFNPKGSLDQIIVISVFAGTHGMAWILANSFVSSKAASDIHRDLHEKDEEAFSNIMASNVENLSTLDQLEQKLDNMILDDIDLDTGISNSETYEEDQNVNINDDNGKSSNTCEQNQNKQHEENSTSEDTNTQKQENTSDIDKTNKKIDADKTS
ncbi:hypothetical protein [Bacillus paranthracis]|uniref:hypothetical protein n=1 Tax=Bacillus paranthracis TaxID=2026186 RepID=UPI003CED21A4